MTRTRHRRSLGQGTAVLVLLAAVVLGPTALTAQETAPPPHLYVFTTAYGFDHPSTPHGVEVITAIAERTGAFTVEIGTDAADFGPALYERADAITFVNTTGEFPLTPDQRRGLLRYFACGGGHVGIHASADANYTWPDWIEAVGAIFTSHPHMGYVPLLTDATLFVEDQQHPATAPWHGQEDFRIAEEHYRWRTNPRDTQDLRTLLSLDETSTMPIIADQLGGYEPRQPLAWAKTFRGLGRVFYTNLGHNDFTFDRADWHAHFVGGVEWVAQIRPDQACLRAQGPVVERVTAPTSEPGGEGVDYAPERTAALVSQRVADTADAVVIASTEAFADGLAGAPLAAHLDAPLLFSTPDELSEATAEEIDRLGADLAILLGGEAVLSAAVADDLAERGLEVQRIGGADRFATAALIAAELPAAGPVYVATGTHPIPERAGVDALAASGVAAATGRPILLVDHDAVPAATAAALHGRPIRVVGGQAAVTDEAVAALQELVGDVSRLAGPTRYATAAATARAALEDGVAGAEVWLASGGDAVNALAAGAAAGRRDGLLLLVDGTGLPASPDAVELLSRRAGALDAVVVVGPDDDVTHTTVARLQQLLVEAVR